MNPRNCEIFSWKKKKWLNDINGDIILKWIHSLQFKQYHNKVRVDYKDGSLYDTIWNDIREATGYDAKPGNNPTILACVLIAYSDILDTSGDLLNLLLTAVDEWVGWGSRDKEYCEQYADRNVAYHGDETNYDRQRERGLRCACCQYIEIECFIRNKVNGNVIRIGSDCVGKGLNEEVHTEIRKEKDFMKRIKQGIPFCEKCTDAHLPVEEGKECPIPPIRVKIPKRLCMTCGIDFKEKEEWKTKCKECYKKSLVNKQNVKLCSKCGTQFNSCESWKKLCISCYRTSR